MRVFSVLTIIRYKGIRCHWSVLLRFYFLIGRIYLPWLSRLSRGRLFTSRTRQRPSWTASGKSLQTPSLWSSWRLKTSACSTALPRPTACRHGACALEQVPAISPLGTLRDKICDWIHFISVFACHPSKKKHNIIFTEPTWTSHWWFFPSLRTGSWKTDRKHDAGHLRIHPSHDSPPQTHADTHIAHFSLTCPITHYGCYTVTCRIFAEHIWHIPQSVATSYTFICKIFLNHNAEQFLGFCIKKSLFIVSHAHFL